jgi:hypothetical protein
MTAAKRSGWVTVTYVLVAFLFWFTAIGLAIGLGVSVFLEPSVDVNTQAEVEFEGVPEGARVTESPSVDISVLVKDPTAAQRLLALGIEFPPFILVLAIFWFLRRLLLTIRAGDAFTGANVRRLRWIGALMLVGPPLLVFTSRQLTARLVETIDLPYVSHSFQPFSGFELLAALIALVFAEIFAHGVRLREDVEATI